MSSNFLNSIGLGWMDIGYILLGIIVLVVILLIVDHCANSEDK